MPPGVESMVHDFFETQPIKGMTKPNLFSQVSRTIVQTVSLLMYDIVTDDNFRCALLLPPRRTT